MGEMVEMLNNMWEGIYVSHTKVLQQVNKYENDGKTFYKANF